MTLIHLHYALQLQILFSQTLRLQKLSNDVIPSSGIVMEVQPVASVRLNVGFEVRWVDIRESF